MQVEDHPLEYGDFEGIIPEGEYGGGTVLLWDKGTWEPVEDGRKGYRDGALKFILHGEKLQGKWMLVRRGGKRADPSERHWFLFKERDEFAKPELGHCQPKSPLSVVHGTRFGRDCSQADRVWGPDGEVRTSGAKGRAVTRETRRQVATKPLKRRPKASRRKPRSPRHSKQSEANQAPFPKQAQVQLATLAKKTPDTDDWMHEIKFDGYRMLCHVKDRKSSFHQPKRQRLDRQF